MNEKLNWAWFAGLFEGEGCIGYTGVNSVTLHINSTDKDIIEKIREVTQAGGITGPLVKSGRKDQWCWYLTNSVEVTRILINIKPFLGKRRLGKAEGGLERLKNVQKKGFCIRNHPLEGDNLYISPKGSRQCRTCSRIRSRNRKKS